MVKFTNFEELVELAPTLIKRKLEQLECLRERPDYHPEPNTKEHIKIVTERLIKTGDINLILSGVFHDICKFDTARLNHKNGYPTSPGHDAWAASLIRNNQEIQDFIQSLGGNIVQIAEICENHMRIKLFSEMKQSKQDAMKALPTYSKLLIFTEADNMLKEFKYEI